MSTTTVAGLFFLGVACGACRSSTDICPTVLKPAIVVDVKDAETGRAVAQGAYGTVREGVYVDSLRPYSLLSADPATLISLQAALGRPGEYAVSVERNGYRPWTVAGIRVSASACGPRTVTLHANLLPVLP